jgi:signal transduction histidine kinase
LDFSGNLNLNLLLKRVVNRVRQLVDAQGAEFGLVDFDKEQVVVLLSENPWQDYSGYIFPFMSGVTGRVAALGEPIVVADYHDWSGKKQEDFKAPFTSVAGVPLKISGEVIGTLVVQDDRPSRAFVAKDLKILEMLAPQLAIFIRNARLYEELEERIKAQGITEERLIRSAKLAAVGEMAAGVAHELNNPLTTVTGFAELVLDSLSKESPEYEDMTLVLQEAHRARSVVRRLLDFSRQGEVLRTAVDINELLTNVLALVHHLALTSNVEVRVELWDGMPKVRADRNQMQQVFLNLIHNSLQAMPDGGELVLQTFVEERNGEKWIAAKVQDNGQGIKEEDLDQVFEPFFTTKPSGKGTGLGLSVSYGIVSDHGGYIEVESQEGEGAIFTVWLPVEVPVVEAAEQRNA